MWVGPLLEYKEHMHKCVDGAAAFIKARLEPMPVTLFCSSIATEPSKGISKSCSLKSNPPNPQADLQPVPAKQACSGRETGSKAPKHVKDVQKWQQNAQTEAAKLAPQAVTKVVLCRHFEKLGTCRLGAKCRGTTEAESEAESCFEFVVMQLKRVCSLNTRMVLFLGTSRCSGVPLLMARRSCRPNRIARDCARPCCAGISSRATAWSSNLPEIRPEGEGLGT